MSLGEAPESEKVSSPIQEGSLFKIGTLDAARFHVEWRRPHDDLGDPLGGEAELNGVNTRGETYV